MKVTIIGSGNVAWHLAYSLRCAGADIVQVYSRNLANAQALADRVNAGAIDNLVDLDNDTEILIFSVKDDSIPEILSNMGKRKDVLMFHTAGAVSKEIFQNYSDAFGVLYPLQTFSKNKNVDFSEIPLFIEGNNPDSEMQIKNIALLLSKKIFIADSEQRQRLHLAAVFACNFTNYLFDVAGKIVQEASFPYEVLLPLIKETVDKVQILSPYNAQTGPALRNDIKTMNKHLEYLKNDETLQQIYRVFSEGIIKRHLG